MLSVTEEDLNTACSSQRFASLVVTRGRFEDIQALIDTCRYVWWQEVSSSDVLRDMASQPIAQGHVKHSEVVCKIAPSQSTLLQAHITDWLAAFAAHPRIGDLDKLKAKYSQFAKLSQTEQATAATASGDVLQVLPDPSWCFYSFYAASKLAAYYATGTTILQ